MLENELTQLGRVLSRMVWLWEHLDTAPFLDKCIYDVSNVGFLPVLELNEGPLDVVL